MDNRLAIRLTLGAALVIVSAACTVNSTDIPALAGPSELALGFRLAATPDSITQDGVSQSAVTVTAFGANGQPAAGVSFRLDMLVGGVPADYGRLSGKSVVTGSDGKATAVYTAPPAVPSGGDVGACSPSIFSPTLPGTCVTVSATPILNGFNNGTNSQTVDIHLVPLGVILPPADVPTASFVVTPEPVTVNVPVFFDGSASCGGQGTGGQCNSGNTIVSYSWGFGDGAAATGRAVSHSYGAAGTYSVTLTVTNDGGRSASVTKPVSVAAGTNPTANFEFSPSAPAVGQDVQFNATTSTAAPGRTLVRWDWNWGDGETGSGQLETHDFVAAGTFNVTLTVTDDTGLTATRARSVAVGTANPTAQLTLVKTGALNIQADASASTAVGSATITTYSFNWGDGSPIESGVAQVRTHNYATTTGAGTYTVRLTVTDSLLRTGTVTQSVTVP